MKRWAPPALYNSKPWVMIVGGAILCLGAMFLSIYYGDWTVLRGLSCFAGAGLVIAGGAILQLRQTYRARSKWYRNRPR
jgi:hypothetical protein